MMFNIVLKDKPDVIDSSGHDISQKSLYLVSSDAHELGVEWHLPGILYTCKTTNHLVYLLVLGILNGC